MALGGRAIHRRSNAGEIASAAWQALAARVATHVTWLALAGAAATVALLYGDALGFAFFFDDTFDLTRVEGRSVWSLLSSSEGYSYYRPLPFVVWKLFRDLQGHYDQSTLHALPLIAHALAGWFLFLLVRRLGFGCWALLPAALFLTYPFSYQSIAIVGTLFHPLTGAAILAALVLYQRAREPAAERPLAAHVAALGCTCVALWSHESGIAIAPLVVGLEGLSLLRARSHRPSPWLYAHLAAAALFILAWFTVEKAPSAERTSLGELHPKGLFLLQGFTYPFSAQLVWLEDRIGWAPGLLETGLLALGFGFAAFAFAGWLAGGRGAALRSLAAPTLALGVSVAVFLPPLARLSWGYVQDSPRLLYLVGIGAAVFWGLLPSLDLRHPMATRLWRIATCALLAGVVAQSWRFVDVRMTMFARATEVVNGIVALGEQYRGQRVLVMNAPAWFAQDRYEYLYGHYGVQITPSYIGLDRVIYTSSDITAYTEAASASWNADVSGGVYHFGPHGAPAPPEHIDQYLREGRELIDVRPQGERFIVRDAGRLVPGAAAPLADFPGSIASSVSLSPARVARTDAGIVILFAWHVRAPLGLDANAVVEVRDPNGNVVARYVGYPLAGFSAPRLWRAGDRIDDSVFVGLPGSGEYTIWAGLSRVADDQPLAATTTSGSPAPGDMLRIGAFTIP